MRRASSCNFRSVRERFEEEFWDDRPECSGRRGGRRYVQPRRDLRVNRFDLAWLLWCSPSMLPIPGTFSVVHLEESVAAASLKLDEEEIATLAG